MSQVLQVSEVVAALKNKGQTEHAQAFASSYNLAGLALLINSALGLTPSNYLKIPFLCDVGAALTLD